MVNIKLLFIILEIGNDKKIKNILNKFGIQVKTASYARGTASPSILSYFGLTETEKEMFMAIIPDYLCGEILDKINNDLKLNNVGVGLAFTVPILSSNKFLSAIFSKNDLVGSDVEMKNENKIKYHLIMTIVAEGYLEKVMSAAKKAGSTGGTVINGRGLSSNKAAKVLGFNIEPEKDIVLNIVSDENKTKVMEEITKEAGIKTKGMGVCLSLPIDDVIGLDIYD